MRFASAQKWTVYLAAGAAILAALLSGELDPVTMILALVGTVASWWLEAPRVRVERLTPVFTVLAVVAMVFAALTALTGEILLAGTRFIIHLLLIKLCTRRAARDVQQVLLLSTLLIAAGTAINTGPSYALCFALFVVFMTWALILFHLRREMEDNFLLKHSAAETRAVELGRVLGSRRIVGTSFFLATGGVSLVILTAAAVFFLAFPRIGFGLFFQKQRSGINVTGFSERVELGGHGTIRDDDTVVMRVITDDPRARGDAVNALHWRGVAFDTYQDGRWTRMDLQRHAGDRDIQPLNSHLDVHFSDQRGQHHGRPFQQDVYLEPLDSDVLFAASLPARFTVPNIGTGSRQRIVHETSDQVARIEHSAGIRYQAVSYPDPPDTTLLAAAGPADAKRFARDLQLPANLPPRIRELAARITEGADTPLEKIQRIDAYLHGYTYSLEIKHEDGHEPLDYFLFESRAGHCEYFATAMAILARAVGVPARNVNGFLGGEWNDYGGYIAVRSGDAHSWVELWFDGVGWVSWDPTPAGAVGTDEGVLASMHRFLDTLRLQYFKWVLEYDLSRQLSLFRELGDALGLSGGKLSGKKLGTWVRAHKGFLVGLLVSVVVVVALVVWWRNRKQRGPRAAAARPRTTGPVIQLYEKTARRLARAGFSRPAAETPREHARRLEQAGAPGAMAFGELTEHYYAVRFGDEAVGLETVRPLADQVVRALAARKRA
jgi:transglutaminase-like putative cysteine protease